MRGACGVGRGQESAGASAGAGSWKPCPLCLSTLQHLPVAPADGQNLVLHEFAHQLDFENQSSDGTPALETRGDHLAWARVMSAEFNALRNGSDQGEAGVIDDYGGDQSGGVLRGDHRSILRAAPRSPEKASRALRAAPEILQAGSIALFRRAASTVRKRDPDEKKRKPEPLANVLGSFLKESKLEERVEAAQVVPEWESLVGKQIATVTKPISVTSGRDAFRVGEDQRLDDRAVADGASAAARAQREGGARRG